MIFAIPYSFTNYLSDLLYALGSVTVLVLALEAPAFKAILQTIILRWLGRISYSLYLVHLPIVYLVYNRLNGYEPPAAVCIAALAASLLTATAVNRWIEAPAHRLGRRLAKKSGTPHETA